MGRPRKTRPSGDEVTDADTVVIEPVASVPVVTEPSALKPGQVYVDLLDENRKHAQRIAIDENQRGYRLTIDGRTWDHVSDHADGTWQYAV